MATEDAFGDETTWGELDLQCRAEVGVDPPLKAY
jgi:hypothetical protein